MDPDVHEDLVGQMTATPRNLTTAARQRMVRRNLCMVAFRRFWRCLHGTSNAIDRMGIGFMVLLLLLVWLLSFRNLLPRSVIQDLYQHLWNDECDQPLRWLYGIAVVAICIKLPSAALVNFLTRLPRLQRLASCLRCCICPLTLPVLFWPPAALILVMRATHCPVEQTDFVWISLSACLILIVAIGCITLRPTIEFLLIRCGCMRDTREDGARDFPQVQFDEQASRDDAVDGYPSSCPVCCDDFSYDQDIICTQCTDRGHVFHRSCLAGWLHMSRTCPLCRHELPVGSVMETRVGGAVQLVAQAENCMNRFLRAIYMEHLTTD